MTGADQWIARAAARATGYWVDLRGDDPLLVSVLGVGPMTASIGRAFLGVGCAFTTARAVAPYVGVTPPGPPGPWSKPLRAQ